MSGDTDRAVEAPDGTREFVDFAVEFLVLSLGEDHPTVRAGRRIVSALASSRPAAPDSPSVPDHDEACGAILNCALPTNHAGLHERADGIRWSWHENIDHLPRRPSAALPVREDEPTGINPIDG